MVLEQQEKHDSQWAAITSIAGVSAAFVRRKSEGGATT
jgi:hypothetical protein